jgi:hypothetical protein
MAVEGALDEKRWKVMLSDRALLTQLERALTLFKLFFLKSVLSNIM